MARRKSGADDEMLGRLQAASGETVDARTRLRAFEDEHFGKDAARVDGHVEDGFGSLYERASDDVRKRHAALKDLIAAEAALAAAKAALAEAQARYGEAEHAAGQ